MAKHLLDPQKLNPSWKTEVSKSSWIKPWLDVRHCASYHCMQFWGKLMKQTWENGKKPSFGTSWGPFDPNSGSQIYIYFFKNLAPSATRYHGHLSSCTISEKSNDPILRKLREGRTDRPTNGPEWFHRTLSN